jgi:hypothetical protein
LSDLQTGFRLAEIGRSAHPLIQLYALGWMEPNNPKKFVAMGGSATADAPTMVLLHGELVLLGQLTLGFDVGFNVGFGNWLQFGIGLAIQFASRVYRLIRVLGGEFGGFAIVVCVEIVIFFSVFGLFRILVFLVILLLGGGEARRGSVGWRGRRSRIWRRL